MKKNFTPIKLRKASPSHWGGLFFKSVLIVVTIVTGAYMVNQFVYRSKASADVATVTFVPQQLSLTEGETFTQSLQITTAEKKLSGVELILDYNSQYLEYVPQSETEMLGATLPANYFTARLVETANSANRLNQLRLVLIANKADAELGSSVIIPLKFQALKKTTVAQSLTLNEPQSEIVGVTGTATDHTFAINSTAASSQIIIGTTTSCSNDSQCGTNANCNSSSTCACVSGFYNCDNSWDNGCEATTECNPAGNVSLKLSLKLQGVNKTPTATNKIKVKLNLTNGSSKEEKSDVELTSSSENNGVFTGTVTFSKIIPGPGYQLYVKGPKHVQKRFCSAAPTGGAEYRCSSNEQIIITSGENTLNLVEVPLLSGDLPLPQDGVLNSRDVVALKKCINKTDAECLNIGDLNYDGAVKAQDFSLIIESMGIKYDDEN